MAHGVELEYDVTDDDACREIQVLSHIHGGAHDWKLLDRDKGV